MHVAIPILLSLTVLAPSKPMLTSAKSASPEYGFGLTQKEGRSQSRAMAKTDGWFGQPGAIKICSPCRD